MVKNIIYVQQNEEIAKSILDGIAGSGYEVFHCVTAAEAFNLMTRQDAHLLMLDINIPDMRLREVVKRCSEEFPATVLAVFTDYPNSELLTKLINRHGIYKIFVAPWDTAQIVEQIEDAMEYAEIRSEQLQREGALVLENKEFDTTLDTLRDSLQFQKYSYYKINAIQHTLLRVTTENVIGDLSEENKRKVYQFSSGAIEGLIKSQTTTSLNVNAMENIIRGDLESFHTIQSKTIESCLIGDIPRVMIANVKALIWMILYYVSKDQVSCEAEILSSYLTNTRIYLEVNVRFDKIIPIITLENPLEEAYDKIMRELMTPMTAAIDIIRKDQEISFQLQVPISYLD